MLILEGIQFICTEEREIRIESEMRRCPFSNSLCLNFPIYRPATFSATKLLLLSYSYLRAHRRARALIARTRNKGIRIRVLRRTLLHPTLTMNNCTLAGVHLLNEISHADM